MTTLDVLDAASVDSPTSVVTIGGLPITVIDRAQEADLMIRLARSRRAVPLFFTSANGEGIARTASDPEQARLFALADQILADGQPLGIASRFLFAERLPERVATTDVFHDVAKLAEDTGPSFYLFGATEAENARALTVARATYPRLDVIGASHGYLGGEALEAKLAEINTLGPDILWLGLGVPREQNFFRDHGRKLSNVGLIKPAGGLFDHMAGKTRRAPLLAQRLGFEWLWRLLME